MIHYGENTHPCHQLSSWSCTARCRIKIICLIRRLINWARLSVAFLGSRSFRSLWNSLIVSNAISGSFKIKFVERWRGKFYLNPVDRSAAVCCLLLDIGLIEFVNILVFWPSQCPARPAVQRSATIIIFIEMPRAPRPVSATGLTEEGW